MQHIFHAEQFLSSNSQYNLWRNQPVVDFNCSDDFEALLKFVSQTYEFPEDGEDDPKKKIHLQLWDTAGQERFAIRDLWDLNHSLTPVLSERALFSIYSNTANTTHFQKVARCPFYRFVWNWRFHYRDFAVHVTFHVQGHIGVYFNKKIR